MTVLGQNPNNLAINLSIGLLALGGLAFGLARGARWLRFLAVPLIGLLGMGIVDTGSRGGLVALGAGLLAYMLQVRPVRVQIQKGLVVLGMIGFFVWASEHSTVMSQRVELVTETRSLSQRERLWPAAWQMFLERPIHGWGPVTAIYELGARAPRRDYPYIEAHNIFLDILIESGLLGGIPFFTGLGLWLYGAWRARPGPHSVLPIALTLAVFIAKMSGAWIYSRMHWFVMAYALAAGDLVAESGTPSTAVAGGDGSHLRPVHRAGRGMSERRTE